jgi:hypothetical protein
MRECFPFTRKTGRLRGSLRLDSAKEDYRTSRTYALLNDPTVSVRVTKGPSARKIYRSNTQFPGQLTR